MPAPAEPRCRPTFRWTQSCPCPHETAALRPSSATIVARGASSCDTSPVTFFGAGATGGLLAAGAGVVVGFLAAGGVTGFFAGGFFGAAFAERADDADLERDEVGRRAERRDE